MAWSAIFMAARHWLGSCKARQRRAPPSSCGSSGGQRFATPLKAATLAAAALIATPYAFAYDMAAIAAPAAFLASDQMRHGFLRGEQAIVMALFGASLAVLVAFGDRPGGITFGSTPIGPLVAMTLMGVIITRVCCCVDTRRLPHKRDGRAPSSSPVLSA
jgi:hypothetical protein